MVVRVACSLVVALMGLPLGCDGDEGTTAADTASVADTSDNADTASATDTVGSEDAGVDGGLVGGCAEDDLPACDYPPAGLSYKTIDGPSLTDEVTGRVLPVRLRIPISTTSTSSPVVVWSHGGALSDTGHLMSDAWGDVLASHGYVVIHVGHALLDGETGPAVCGLASIPTADCLTGADDGENSLLVIVRSYDLRAVLRKLPALSTASVDGGGPALDLDRVAVAGWSGGSRGPILLMGAKVNTVGGAPRFDNPDPLPRAAVALSPTGPGFGGFYDTGTETSWDTLRGPTLLVTGANDVKDKSPGLTGPVRRTPFDKQPADGARWLLYSNLPVGVGGHGSYNLGDIASNDTRLVRLSRAVRSSVLAFLDAKVRGNAAAALWLSSDAARVLAGDAEWLQR